MPHQTKTRKKCRFFPGFGLFGRQKIPKIIEKYTTFLQVSWREGPRSGKINPFSGFVSTREPFWNIFFEPCLENVAKHGGEMVAPNFCQNPTRENAGFFFSKKCLFLGKKTRFSKKIRAGAMPLSKKKGAGGRGGEGGVVIPTTKPALAPTRPHPGHGQRPKKSVAGMGAGRG